MPSKKKSDIKQKQKQSQNVKVIVNLADKKVKRKKRAKRKPTQEPAVVDFKAFPPQIIYPSAPLTFYNRDVFPETASILEKPPVPKSLASGLEDVGNVGTSEILSAPSKQETLEALGDIVPLKSDNIGLTLAENVNNAQIPENFTDFGISAEQVAVERRPRRTKKEMAEARGMIQEDIASYNLRLGIPSFIRGTPMDDMRSEISGLTTKESRGSKKR